MQKQKNLLDFSTTSPGLFVFNSDSLYGVENTTEQTDDPEGQEASTPEQYFYKKLGKKKEKATYFKLLFHTTFKGFEF